MAYEMRVDSPSPDPKTMSTKPSICFVALAAWPILSRSRDIKFAGGAEVQQCNIARGLASLGYRVSMICMDYGQPDGTIIDGVRVYNAHKPSEGLPVLRFVHPRFTSIWRAMRRCNADVYYQRCAGGHTAYVAAFCQKYGKRFIYAAAHDADFDHTLPYIRLKRDRMLFRWGLHRAHTVVVQNPAQLEACHRVRYGPCTMVKSCYVPPSGNRAGTEGYVLWVGSLREWKRPEWFIELARRLPQLRFRMVGGTDDANYERRLRSFAGPVTNLDVLGFIPYADVEEQFDGAQIFVNTSVHEGFPNTYLQAWARAIPTVGTVATGVVWDGVPVEIQVRTLDELADTVSRLTSDSVACRDAGKRCLSCFKEQHSLEAVLGDYVHLIESVLQRGNNTQ
ncbi:MAG: glycosyltransferase family 4 protein [Sulfobacillus sp.]